MVGSDRQGRDTIGKLVEEDEISDLLEYDHMEGMADRDIIYQQDSTKNWISANESIDLNEYR